MINAPCFVSCWKIFILSSGISLAVPDAVLILPLHIQADTGQTPGRRLLWASGHGWSSGNWQGEAQGKQSLWPWRCWKVRGVVWEGGEGSLIKNVPLCEPIMARGQRAHSWPRGWEVFSINQHLGQTIYLKQCALYKKEKPVLLESGSSFPLYLEMLRKVLTHIELINLDECWHVGCRTQTLSYK